MSISHNDETHDSSALPEQEQSRILLRFESAWESALQGVQPPKIETFLEELPQPHRPLMRKTLAEMDQGYRARLLDSSVAQGVGTDSDNPATRIRLGNSKARPCASSDGDATSTNSAGGTTEGAQQDPTQGTAGETIASFASPVNVSGTDDAELTAMGVDQTVVMDASEKDPQDDGDEVAFDVDLVPGYEIECELGRGGMGVVYQAQQVALNRTVALKMILAGGHASQDQLDRFQEEAKSVARLQHPNIVQVYDVGEQRGLPYFSLEFVDGKSLKDEIDSKPIPFKLAAEWMETISRAMHYAHLQGIVHRDLKPANILLTSDGIPKITDFGLAKNLESDSSQTRTGAIMGTPNYMAPEQGEGTKQVGPVADVYALGSILYAMTTGRPPFLAATSYQTLKLLLSEEPVRPLQLRPDIPADLETIILKCLQKDPQKRYETAQDLAQDLHRFLAGEPILARPVSGLERTWRWCRRNKLVAGLSATAVLLLLGLALGGVTAAVLINNQRNIAVSQTGLAKASEKRAVQNEQEAVKNALDARDAQQLAELNAKVAKRQGQLALAALSSLVTNVQTQLNDTAGTFELKQSLLQTALDGLRQLARTEEIDGYAADLSIAVAHQRMGKILQYLGKPQEARDEYERFHKIIVSVSGPQPSLAAKGNLAISLSTLGDVSLLLGDRQKAWDYYSQSHQLRKEVADQSPGSAKAQIRLATSYMKLGDAGDAAQAEEYYFKALALRKELAGDDVATASPERLRDVWIVHNKIADLLLRKHADSSEALKRAEAHYQDGFEIASAVYKRNPNSPQAKQDLSSSHLNFGNLALRRGDDDGAQRQYNQALELLESVAHDDTENIDVQGRYALLLARCRRHEQAAEKAEDLRAMAPRVYRNLYNVACCYSLCARATDDADLKQKYKQIALDTLHVAVENGLGDPQFLMIDPDLEGIRDEPQFRQLIDRMSQSVAVTD